MLDRRSALGGALAVLLLLVIYGPAGWQSPGQAAVASAAALPPAGELPDSLEVAMRYGGRAAGGVDLIWRGQAGGAPPGQVTIRLEYAGPSDERAMPLWPVNAWLFFSADDPRGSFLAELSGSMNWRTGELRVTGLVSDGVRRGTPLDLRLRVSRPARHGTAVVRFLRLSASRT